MYAKDILEETGRKQICYTDEGISAKNRKNVELYKIILFSYSEKFLDICDSIIKELNSFKDSDLENIMNRKQKSLSDSFVCK